MAQHIGADGRPAQRPALTVLVWSPAHRSFRWPYRQTDPDDWYFHQHWDGDRDRHYRDYHEGRGYYKGGVWVQLYAIDDLPRIN
jgi:hypothetical protein